MYRLFCPNCNNILDISKTKPHATVQSLTSLTPEDDVESSTNLITKIISGEEPNEQDIKNIKIENLIKLEEFKKLSNKQKSTIQNKLADMIETKDEANIAAFYICRNCHHSEPIQAQTLLTTKIGTGSSADFYNIEKLRNNVHSKVLPRTRNYICTDESCTSHKNPEKREAVFFKIGSSLQVWYVCTVCKSVWKGE